MDRPVLFLGHLGLGDMITCNGLVRHIAEGGRLVLVVCKRVYVESVGYMYSDSPNIHVLAVEDDRSISPAFGADPAVLSSFVHAGFQVVAVGLHRGYLPVGSGFADAFYDQAGVPRQFRYTKAHAPRDPGVEGRFNRPGCYRFVHDDPARGFRLALRRQPTDAHPGVPDGRPGSSNIFSFVGLMENAAELDTIDSSFAHLADLLDICPGRRRLHAYSKTPDDRCQDLYLRPGWEFVTQANGLAVAHGAPPLV